jgi:hypothetical protein
MAGEDEEAPRVGTDGFILGNCRLEQLRAVLAAALADEPDSLSPLLVLGELSADLLDPLVRLSEESLVLGAPPVHRFRWRTFLSIDRASASSSVSRASSPGSSRP